MKKSLVLTATFAALALASSTFAYHPKDATQPIVAPLKLVPTSFVAPTNLPQTFSQRVLDIEFSLDAAGQPRDIKVLNSNERGVTDQVVKAFKQWKFDAAARGTGPDAATKRFVLPLEIVPTV